MVPLPIRGQSAELPMFTEQVRPAGCVGWRYAGHGLRGRHPDCGHPWRQPAPAGHPRAWCDAFLTRRSVGACARFEPAIDQFTSTRSQPPVALNSTRSGPTSLLDYLLERLQQLHQGHQQRQSVHSGPASLVGERLPNGRLILPVTTRFDVGYRQRHDMGSSGPRSSWKPLHRRRSPVLTLMSWLRSPRS